MNRKEFVNSDNSSCGSIGKYEYISSGIYEEKKSKFYSYIFSINSDKEAAEILYEVRKQFKDARHVVYAYLLDKIYNYSDDGEPSGSAGKIIYSLLEKQNVVNTLVIVIRYFGGVLLGVGPLSRAYLKAVKSAEEKVHIVDYISKTVLEIEFGYNEEPEVKRIIESSKSEIIDTKYSENIVYVVKVPENDIKLFNRYQKSKKII